MLLQDKLLQDKLVQDKLKRFTSLLDNVKANIAKPKFALEVFNRYFEGPRIAAGHGGDYENFRCCDFTGAGDSVCKRFGVYNICGGYAEAACPPDRDSVRFCYDKVFFKEFNGAPDEMCVDGKMVWRRAGAATCPKILRDDEGAVVVDD